MNHIRVASCLGGAGGTISSWEVRGVRTSSVLNRGPLGESVNAGDGESLREFIVERLRLSFVSSGG